MTNLAKDIGLLRSATKHPVRLIWIMTAIAVSGVGWTFQLGMAEGSWLAFLSEICRIGAASSGAQETAAAVLLWATMSLTMMLPAALPMIAAYLNIAEAAGEREMVVVSAGFLIAGYVSAWLAFASAAAALQSVVELTPAMALADRKQAALLLLIAGLYQFAPIKEACLSKCRSPMAYFMTRWSDRVIEVFRMGLEQGAFCLACCWALMLLMFAAGLMNVVWMAGLTILVALEKTLPRPKPVTYGAGAGLIGTGVFGLLGG